MTGPGGGPQRWFDDIPAWPATGATPARELARELASARLGLTDAYSPSAHPEAIAPAVGHDESLTPRSTFDQPATDWESFLATEADKSKQKFRRDSESNSRPGGGWTGKRTAIVGVAAVVLLVLVGSTLALVRVAGGAEEDPAAQPQTTSAETTTATADAGSSCPSNTSGGLTTGNDAGDLQSGPGVIKAFNHAYYVERSAQQAVAVAVPNAVAKQEILQQYIDQVPAGTTHCLSITDRGNNTFSVLLTESSPGKAQVVYRQTIETVQTDGKYLIASIKADE
ncbi:hypothetical protein ACWDTI_04340 [Gordonia sp. NPDC003424]